MDSSLPKVQSRPLNTLVHLIAGTLAGINVVIVGHPFDTLKVRLQTQPNDKPIYNGFVDCFKKTIKWEGVSGLYKGVQSPLIGQMFFRANMFLAFFKAKNYLSNNGTRALSNIDMYIAGGFAWGIGAIIECPIDVLKTQLQIQIIKSKIIKDYKPEFNGIRELASKIWENNKIRGFYQGFSAQLLRNVPAGSLHFGTFELYRKLTAERLNCRVGELSIIHSLIGGGIGGLLYWVPFFPIDVIKSTIQADSPYKRQYYGLLSTSRKLYQEGGYKRFYKGFTPCLIRAVPANAVLLLTSSYISEHLRILLNLTDHGYSINIEINYF